MSRVIFQNRYYVVCLTRAGLSVQRGQTGRLLPPTAPDYATWVKAFETALDAREAAALAKGFLS